MGEIDKLESAPETKTILQLLLDMSERIGHIEQKMSVIPQDRHNEEHDYIKIEIEAKKARRDFYRGVSEKVASTTILGAYGLLLSALGYAFVQWVINLKS